MPILKYENLEYKNFYKNDNSQGYSINYIPQLNSLILYGVLSTSDIYLFSLSKRQWTLIKTSGKKPSFRKFYAHYYHNKINGLIIHGGQIIQKGKKMKSSDQCYILFIHTWQWRKIFLIHSPTSRQFHQFIPINNNNNNNKQLLIFGGFSKPYQTILNDLWSICKIQNISTKTNKHQVHGCEIKRIQTKGISPYVYGYSSLVVNNSQILFIGGQHKTQKKKIQIYALNILKYEWNKLDIQNNILQNIFIPQVYTSAIDPQSIHIYGGINLLQNKNNSKCYTLNLRHLQIIQQQQSIISFEYDNYNINNSHDQNNIIKYSSSCCITQIPLCIAVVEHCFINGEEDVQVNVLYEKNQNQNNIINSQQYIKDSSINSNTINNNINNNNNNNNINNNIINNNNTINKTNENTLQAKYYQDNQHVQQLDQQISIQQYLKAIKHQQILSQQLQHKTSILQQLYKQIQRYISTVYIKKYLNLPIEYINLQIQQQKQKNIKNCQILKRNYIQNNLQYEEIIKNIKLTRLELKQIHQDIQRCIQTEIDQDQNNQ